MIKEKLLNLAREKGYIVVANMLRVQSEAMLKQNIDVARSRLLVVDEVTLKKEIEEDLKTKFRFNSNLSSKFAEVIIEAIYD